MRIALSLILLLAGVACGSAGSGGPSPRPSELRTAVEQIAPFVSFPVFVPEAPTPGVLDRASLYAYQRPGPAGEVLGEPIISVEFVVAPGAKTKLYLIEGPAGCCAEMFQRPDRTPVVIRPARAGAPELRGELLPPRGAAEGASLWWSESSSAGSTFVALRATSVAQLDGQGLIALAQSMLPIDKRPKGDAILLYLSTHTSHSPSGHRVYVAAKAGPVPDEARLLDARGAVIATAPFAAPLSYDCLNAAAGVAAFAVAHEVVDDFGRTVGAGYRVEARIGTAWRPVQLVSSGCVSTE